MKKIILLLSLSCISFSTFADEGMWLPFLLKQLNEKDMKKNGCKLNAEDIYSINKSSLKDAIVQFGGGCTGEIISEKGLVLTNHHCGYSQIAGHSTVEKDYLTNGFWAMNQSEELLNPGLTVTFIVRIEDVTDKVNANIKTAFTDQQRDSSMRANVKQVEAEAIKGTHYESFVRPFFYGNMHLLFVTEIFRDIRLVGAPPSSIGKFGGDTDNWMWPRHTGDFSMFRIYANKNNEPAEYSPENVPYKPKRALTISLKGVEEGDFTMVYGFPGRTQEYLFSDAVDITMNDSDPVKVKLREKRLGIMDEFMKADDKTRIAYAANYASVANYWKKWMGEMQGLQKFDAVNKKKEFEKKFIELVSTDPAEKEKFNQVFNDFHRIYGDYRILNKQMDYYSECLLGINSIAYVRYYDKLIESSKKKSPGLKQDIEKAKSDVTKYYKNFNSGMDKKICTAMLDIYVHDLDKSLRVPYIDSLMTAYGSDAAKLSEYLFTNSALTQADKNAAVLAEFETDPSKIENDPMYMFWKKINTYYTVMVRPYFSNYDAQLNGLYKTYMKGLTDTYKGKTFYPDANSTLRLTYGKVKAYIPRDGVSYKHYTTLEGIMEKENPNSDEFIVSPKLKELYANKDYGQYADKGGKLRVAFIAANHTTGGNSGSPVLNAKGELIGTNFDRVWEGTMSDIMYNPEICRNVTLDVRYTLFVVDKFAGAGYLINEMKIVKD
ncbi:MAG: S46 family peptidase [Bacteroidia bacterium]